MNDDRLTKFAGYFWMLVATPALSAILWVVLAVLFVLCVIAIPPLIVWVAFTGIKEVYSP